MITWSTICLAKIPIHAYLSLSYAHTHTYIIFLETFYECLKKLEKVKLHYSAKRKFHLSKNFGIYVSVLWHITLLLESEEELNYGCKMNFSSRNIGKFSNRWKVKFLFHIFLAYAANFHPKVCIKFNLFIQYLD